MPGKTVLVTGASGFVGRQTLQPLLDLGYEVHAVSRHPLGLPHIKWHSCDLLDPPAVSALLTKVKPSHLLHNAWYAEHGKFWTSLENAKWLEASTHFFEKFLSVGGQRIVGVGTCAEYGWRRKFQIPWRETDPCHAQTIYGQAKLTLLNRLNTISENYAWARVFMLFGPHENPNRLVPYTIRMALSGQDISCTEGSQIRDLIDTRICGRALSQILASNVIGPVNIGSGDPMPVAQLIKQICSLCDYKGNINFGAVAMSKTDPFYMAPDLKRLHDEVKFHERQNTNRSLIEMIDYWRKQQLQ